MKITRCLTAVLLCLALFLCAASFALAADIRPLGTDPAAFDPDNGEFSLTIKDLDMIENGGWFTAVLYLEDHYGIEINHKDFYVTYEAFASNVPPSVFVTPEGSTAASEELP